MSGKDYIGYAQLTDKALRGVVREALMIVNKSGLVGAHHFFITFDTRHPGVRISDALRERYPAEMTIVLQHQFWGLKVTEHEFEVTLTFNKMPETIGVPFIAIRRFSDPSQEFGFQFQSPPAPTQNETIQSKIEAALPAAAEEKKEKEKAAPASAEEAAATVVSLDAFRKK